MLRMIAGLALLLIFTSTLAAQELYVQDNIPITLRSGQGTQYRIAAMISSENTLTYLEEGDGWTRVRLDSGDEGWVLTRYLTKRKPARQVLSEVEQKYAAMQASMAEPEAEIARLTDENQSLREELSGLENTLEKLADDYANLRTEATDYIQVRNSLNEKSLQLEEQLQRAEKCEAALSEFQNKHHIYWFISGAGVLLLGFLLGLSIRRKTRRSSLLA